MLKIIYTFLILFNYVICYNHIGVFVDQKDFDSSLYLEHVPPYVSVNKEQKIPEEYNVFHYVAGLYGYQLDSKKPFTGLYFTTAFQQVKAIVIIKTNKFPGQKDKLLGTIKRTDFMVPHPFKFSFSSSERYLDTVLSKRSSLTDPLQDTIDVICLKSSENIYSLSKALSDQYGDDYILLIEKAEIKTPSYITDKLITDKFGPDCTLCFPLFFQTPKGPENQKYKHFMHECLQLQEELNKQPSNNLLVSCNGLFPSDISKKGVQTSGNAINVTSDNADLFNLNTFAEYDDDYSSHILIQISSIVVLAGVVFFCALLLTSIKSSDDTILARPVIDEKKKND